MAKNKKSGGLIEDRVIRNPMDQMRRKLKFKAKKERKELRVFARTLKEEHIRAHPEPKAHNYSLKMANNNQEDEEYG